MYFCYLLIKCINYLSLNRLYTTSNDLSRIDKAFSFLEIHFSNIMCLGHCEQPPFLLVTLFFFQLQGYIFYGVSAMAPLQLWGIFVAKMGNFFCKFVLFYFTINITKAGIMTKCNSFFVIFYFEIVRNSFKILL